MISVFLPTKWRRKRVVIVVVFVNVLGLIQHTQNSKLLINSKEKNWCWSRRFWVMWISFSVATRWHTIRLTNAMRTSMLCVWFLWWWRQHNKTSILYNMKTNNRSLFANDRFFLLLFCYMWVRMCRNFLYSFLVADLLRDDEQVRSHTSSIDVFTWKHKGFLWG